MRNCVAAVLAALLLAAAAGAGAQTFSAFTIKDIRVEGLQRTEAGTVFSYLPIKVGETMDEEKARRAVRALFATGFFQDVRLEAEGDVLVVFVQERPAIASIDFSGMREFESENVKKALRELGMAEGRIFERAVLETAEQEIKRQYLSRALYGAEVQTTVTPLERNRVAISISVNEGEIAKIRGINIVGAQAFNETMLVDEFVLRTPGWLTWYTKHDRYSRERLATDLESLRAFYQNQGYLDFNVESTQVSITPDRRDIYVTVNIVEGEKYTVSAVELSGQLLVPRPELEKLVQLKPGDIFSREKLAATTKAISERLGNDGYAFANASAIPSVDKDKRTVAFNIVVDPGRRVYVRRVEVTGNTRTRDEVVRREMRQLEGAYYDASKIQLSRRRIDRTQYFSDVTVDTQPIEGRADQVDVVYTVKERPTGQLLLGIGFSTVDKVMLSASLSQANVFGTGKYLSFAVSSGSVNQTYSLSYVDPYYTVDGVSRGFDVYRRKTDASGLATGAYATDAIGGGVKYGYPVSEVTTYTFGLSAETVELRTFPGSPQQYIDFANFFGNTYSYVTGSAGWNYDTRDSLIQTNEGTSSRGTGELAGGDLQFYRLSYAHQWYRPLTRTLTFTMGGEIGYAGGIGDQPLPFFKNYYAGGPGSVRGYRSFSLGPQDNTGNNVGGNRRLLANAQLLFPVPGAAQDRSLRLSWFVDGGQVYDGTYDLGQMRYSTGLAFNWVSPFGPLKLSYGKALNPGPTDRLQQIQFTLGAEF
jgi:outer membrane protein insertion porin family